MNPHDLRKDRTVQLSPGENFECHYPVTITSRVFKGGKWFFTVDEATDGGTTQFRAPEAPHIRLCEGVELNPRAIPFLKVAAVVLLVASAFVAGRFDLADKLPDQATIRGGVEDFLAAEKKFHARAHDAVNTAAEAIYTAAREKGAVARDAICTAGDAVYSAACETGRFLVTSLAWYCVFAWVVIIIGAIWGGINIADKRADLCMSAVYFLKKDGLPLWSLLLALLLVPFEVSARIFTAFYQLVAGVLSFGLRRKKKCCSPSG